MIARMTAGATLADAIAAAKAALVRRKAGLDQFLSPTLGFGVCGPGRKAPRRVEEC